ncbi:1584_t:CDS:2 [Dentiscutata heterogama]|uniref:1584_t:CDS:1 n=1 Tax=Dentiscutata heterogama TaxID=1316150 RepID=A0ACA9K600_9GLOM|nr:1584_t:CDS:2 [Dentiscutata heterogama]
MQNGEIVEDISNEDWKWPCFEEWFDRNKWEMVQERKNECSEENFPFKVIYSVDRDGIRNTFVEFGFQPLITTLQSIIPGNRIIRDKKPKVNAKDLYYIKEKLHLKLEKVSSSTIEKIYLNKLVKFLDQEYEQTDENKARMIKNNAVTFDMLWVFYTPKLPVWYACKMSGQKLGGIVTSTSEEFDYNTQQRVFYINIKVIDYDSVGFKQCSILSRIGYFEGEMSFSALPVMPSKFCKVQDKITKIVAENGKKFFELATERHFKNYEGPLLRWKQVNNCMQVEKINANGRVMIDLESFAVMNPDYKMGNALPPNKCDIELLVENDAYLNKDKLHQEDNYLLAPALVYGFSFALKEWGQFEVSKFTDIQFGKDALDYLVMPPNKKDIIKGLVKQYVVTGKNNDRNGLDPIREKGNGCIFLCYGPPGTGKTLTAECVAEFLERPLWTLSVHELGTEPKDLEKQLVKVLDVAYKWKSVLLLDEADIYLEKRSTTDLNRNMMVGIFLRLLEYYQGVLFMTTNRVANFDDAICSRISMFLHYPKLDQDRRREVWTNFTKRANLSLKIDDLIKYELNGRDIRKIISTAQMLARDRNEGLTADLVIDVIESIQTFQEDTNEKQNVKMNGNGVLFQN